MKALFGRKFTDIKELIEGNISRKDSEGFLEGYIGNHTKDDVFIELKGNNFINDQQYKLDELGNNEYTMNPYEQYDGLIYIDTIEK